MNTSWMRGVQGLGVVAVLGAGLFAGCGGGGGANHDGFQTGDASVDGSTDGGPSLLGDSGEGGLIGTMGNIKSLAIEPPTASILSNNGTKPTQAFTVKATYTDGSTGTISSGITWGIDAPLVGAIDGSGKFTASGQLGGLVNVSVAYGSIQATAKLTVKLLVTSNPGTVPTTVQKSLEGAKTKDTTTTWAYPYDGTVWPRGLLPPVLQWKGGAATDDYYVHVTNPTFELQEFSTATGAPASQLALDPTQWAQLTGSTAGSATISVARWDGTAATVVTTQSWTIAAASMRGTIYYWSNNLGRVLRIQPGAAMPDDFANHPPLDPTQSSCLMTCHTVSANGSVIVSGGGDFGGSYDLATGMPMHSLGGLWGPSDGGPSASTVVQWMMPAVSPDGTYMLTNAMAEGLAYVNNNPPLSGFLGLYDTSSGAPVTTSGVQNVPMAQPAWSPEGSRVVYVDTPDPVTGSWTSNWNDPPAADLKVYEFDEKKNPMFFGNQTLVATGTDPNQRIAWPTVSPDGKWVVYSRTTGADTRSLPATMGAAGPSDLYMAPADKPGKEVRLSQVDGDKYPFLAGMRDLGWNFEPSFAPVAAGGYFWAVFTSRRTYGVRNEGQALPCASYVGSSWPQAGCSADPSCASDSCNTMCACSTTTEVKQLWVFAIDQNPKPGVDPSHPAFHLTGQDESNLAMRGYWALPPCAKNGSSCGSGSDCCGGYCAPSGDGGAPVCQSMPQGCSQDGDKCEKTSDCCGAAQGVTCINHFCAEPAPQ